MDASEKVDPGVSHEGDVRVLAQVIPVNQRGELRPFVSLDDLERIAADDPTWVSKTLVYSRRVWESIGDHPTLKYVLESED